uniref:Mammalian ependymin-related protein 1 n=1 Tax=Accipiter nisus TaxID=211598 RepID=A0A8B9NIJ9_9AVES
MARAAGELRLLRPGPEPGLLLLLLLLLLLGGLLVRSGGAAAAGPEPCQAPRQWEGRTVSYEHGTGRNRRAAVSYDGPNQRLRILEERKALIPCKNAKSVQGVRMHLSPVGQGTHSHCTGCPALEDLPVLNLYSRYLLSL